MSDDVLPRDGAPPHRRGFFRRNVFAIWGGLMLVGGITRLLIYRDGTGLVGVGFGMAFLLIDGVSRYTTDLLRHR